MNNPADFTKAFQDAFANMKFDTSAFEDAFKSSAAVGEKMSKVAIEAATKSAEVSNTWTKDTLNKLGVVSSAKAEAADYSKAVSDFATSSAEVAAENMAAFAEIAKKVQMETVELMMASGKEMQKEATAAVKKATDDVAKATKKAAAK